MAQMRTDKIKLFIVDNYGVSQVVNSYLAFVRCARISVSRPNFLTR
jgi:hypothetical protein